MKTPIKINSLELELTRKCNLSCKHCMRGNSESIDMSTTIIEHILNSEDHKIIEINECLLTGGEPFMNIEGFIFFLEYLISKNIKVHEINVVTNALIYNKDIIKLLKNLENKNTIISLITKLDQFHLPIPSKNLKLFTKTEFYDCYKETLTEENIISIGRAYENNLGNISNHDKILNSFQNSVKDYLLVIYLREKAITIDSLYITAKGYFGSSASDATWQMIDEKYKLNILKDSLFTNCELKGLDYDLKYLEENGASLPIERFIDDFREFYEQDNIETFYESLNEELIRDYLINPYIRKRIRN